MFLNSILRFPVREHQFNLGLGFRVQGLGFRSRDVKARVKTANLFDATAN